MPSARNLLAACIPVVLVTYEERAGSVGRLPWSATLAASSNRGEGHTTGGSDERQEQSPGGRVALADGARHGGRLPGGRRQVPLSRCPRARRPYELAFKTLSERKDPLDKIDKACRAEEPFYGASWDIDFERPRPDLFEMNVRRCFWHDFFARHDAMLVTTVMCSWDTNWMRAIDPAVSGLRAERTSLLSLGDDQCRFAVLETDDPLAGYSDKIEQRFTGQQESG
ncbi:MAG TPA: L-2-amino-thiazoline-4-carboxylic acid hydrolase [Gemmatimonadales bacterium]|nr:L-2-amino-thiazoline-4-carboxylic acid hydrolase [Gemmatimonadales bacterium]